MIGNGLRIVWSSGVFADGGMVMHVLYAIKKHDS